MKNFIVVAIIIGVSIIIGCTLIKPSVTNQYGAAAGPEHYQTQVFLAGIIDSGDVTTITCGSGGTTTITAKQFIESKIILFDPDDGHLGNASTTLFSSTTLSTYFTHNGDSHEILFRNIGAGTSTWIVAGSGIDMFEPTGGDVLIETGHDVVLE